MQKQPFILAASFLFTLAMSSVGQAQSHTIKNQYFKINETNHRIVSGHQGFIQPASVMPIEMQVDSSSAYAPAPPIPFTQSVSPFAVPVTQTAPPMPYIERPFQPALSPIKNMMPTATFQQPVCASSG